jgi:hypothetical protein
MTLARPTRGIVMPKAMPLLAKPGPAKARKAQPAALPMLVSELADCELHAHCDRCGRQLRLHPGPHDINPRARLSSLLAVLVCRAQRGGHSCGGYPRRLILIRDEQQWMLEAGGEWVEDSAAYWEAADFAPEAMSAH